MSIGSPAVSQLADLAGHPDAMLRREVIKTLGQIASPVSVPLLVHAMLDGNEGVRWLAAEGLVAVGMQASQPVLEELLANPKSALLRKGAHHYFRAMRDLKGSTRFDELLSALDGLDAELRTQVAAENLLKSGNPGVTG